MNEFYPTPLSLAYKAVGKFQNRKFTHILECSAGRGDLLVPLAEKEQFGRRHEIDCVEIDLDNQAILRDKGFNVVGMDFMTFSGHAIYSHLLLNPPFSAGVDHVLKAWDLLFDGEMVAIINAESLRNPCTANRKLLSQIIEDNGGTVEFMQEAFLSPDTQRKTSVEIALLHLSKKADLGYGLDEIISGLKTEQEPLLKIKERNEIAIREGSISNSVRTFNIAVQALKESCLANDKAAHYFRMLGARPTFYKYDDKIGVGAITRSFNEQYIDLKKQAWDSILNSTDFSKHLTAQAYNELKGSFDDVCKLEFTEANIRGFLVGLVEQKSSYNMKMLLEVFDLISAYHSENRVYYRGWKSNTKHRTNAFRIKTTRFILPRANSWGSISWEFQRMMEDFDKTFAMLAGDAEPPIKLASVLSRGIEPGQRYQTSYFDVRYFQGTGTVHFFPTRKDLIDRLNRLVGAERKWLPHESEKANAAFWEQYDKAEAINQAMVMPNRGRWSKPTEEDIAAVHLAACEKLGINMDFLLTHETEIAGLLPDTVAA